MENLKIWASEDEGLEEPGEQLSHEKSIRERDWNVIKAKYMKISFF